MATVRRFLYEARGHLNPGGHILLGYSDSSGARAIERLEGFIAEAGLEIKDMVSVRIQTRRARRKWERVLVYELVMA